VALLLEPVEKLDQLELIVQVVLEPEDDFLMLAEPVELRVTTDEVAKHLFEDAPSLFRNETHAHCSQLLGGEAGRDRAFVEYVAPGKNFTG
jgi:hypothetical protein